MGKKDTKAKEYLQNNERFADLFNYHLFDGKQVILSDDLYERDSAEKISIQDIVALERFRDLIKFTIVKHSAAAMFVLLGLEIQDEVHYAMPVRTMLYDSIQYASQVKKIAADHGTADYKGGAEFLSGFKRTDRIIPVISLVVYLSASAWDGPRCLHDMMEFTDPSLRKYINDYKLHLIIPAEMDDFEKFKTEVGALLEIIKASNDKNAMRDLLHSKEQFQNLDNETIQTINAAIGTRIQIGKKGEKTDMCNAIEEMINDSKNEKKEEFENAAKLIGEGIDTFEGLISKGISEDTARILINLVAAISAKKSEK